MVFGRNLKKRIETRCLTGFLGLYSTGIYWLGKKIGSRKFSDFSSKNKNLSDSISLPSQDNYMGQSSKSPSKSSVSSLLLNFLPNTKDAQGLSKNESNRRKRNVCAKHTVNFSHHRTTAKGRWNSCSPARKPTPKTTKSPKDVNDRVDENFAQTLSGSRLKC
jgi:hypothetical protein